MSASGLQERLATGEPIVMDGGCGSELHKLITADPTLWLGVALRSHGGRKALRKVQESFAEAGAELLITGTFRTQRHTYSKAHLGGKARCDTIAACRIARHAAQKFGSGIIVAGSAAPLEDCYSPELVPSAKVLAREHADHAENLARGGIRLLLAETMNNGPEAVAALKAGSDAGLDVAVSFFMAQSGRELASGESLIDVLKAIEPYAPVTVGFNCNEVDVTTRAVGYFASLQTEWPLAVYAQGGEDLSNPLPIDEVGYLTHADQWLQLGARVVGGCCGVSPSYIQQIGNLVKEYQPQ